jgi:hypothetical protein
MTRGKFAEAARAFMRIMPEQREAVLHLTSDARDKSLANRSLQSKRRDSRFYSRVFIAPGQCW